jgi:hypothetical protein
MGVALAACVLVGGAVLAADTKPAETKAAENPNETRKVLSTHKTVAKLKGIAYQQCRGMTSMCPNECGNSGDFATFEVVGYVSYEKTGEYGDPKGTSYSFQVNDNHKNLKVSKELAESVRGLKNGDTVLLDWRHDYVTRKEGGGSSSFPDRVVTKLEKVTPEQGEAKLKEAAGK